MSVWASSIVYVHGTFVDNIIIVLFFSICVILFRMISLLSQAVLSSDMKPLSPLLVLFQISLALDLQEP